MENSDSGAQGPSKAQRGRESLVSKGEAGEEQGSRRGKETDTPPRAVRPSQVVSSPFWSPGRVWGWGEMVQAEAGCGGQGCPCSDGG